MRWLALLSLLLCGPALAFGGRMTVLGQMALPRADAPSVASTGSARSQYVLHCAGCHGLDGRGAPERYVPDLRRMGQFLQIEGGREFVVKVPGVMASGLDDAQVAGVINWLLGSLAREGVPAAQPPYSADEVARARRAPLVDVAAERTRLVTRGRERGLALD